MSAEETKELLELRRRHGRVRAKTSGTVLEVHVTKGDIVQPGESLVWLEATITQHKPILYGYVPVTVGRRIEVGAEVLVELSTIDPQNDGYLIGTVVEVSRFATSVEAVENVIRNPTLIKYLMSGNDAVMQIVVKPKVSPSSQSYLWTTGKGPDEALSTGVVCTIQIIVQRVSPIRYLIPGSDAQRNIQ